MSRLRETRRFFALLAAATILPLLCLPISAHWTENAGFDLSVAVLLFVGAQGHVAASFFFYTEPVARSFMIDERPSRFLVVPLLLVLVTGVSFHLADGSSLFPYFVVAFWVWQTHHYTRQNHGILAFVSRADGASVGRPERTALVLTGIAGIAGMVTFVTPFEDTFLRSFGWQLHNVALGVYACGWVVFFTALRDSSLRRSPLRLGVATLLMLFYLPLFFFSDALSAVMSYAIAHGLQYMVFLYYVSAKPPELRVRALATLAILTVAIGALLKLSEGHNALTLGLGLGVVMWHFVLDAGMWRLSEPFQRSYMAERFSFLGGRD